MNFTKEKIEEYKKKYGKIFLFEVDGRSCILKTAGRNEMSLATIVSTSVGQNSNPVFDPIKYNESILTSCWIDGDEEIKTNDALFLGISEQMAVLIDKSAATVKEL